MMFFIRWCVFFFTWIVRSCMLKYVKKLILVNAYMLIDWDVVGEYIYVNWVVNVVGDCIYVKWWWIVGDYIYAKWLMMMWWWLLIELWLDWLCGRKYLIMQLLLKLINVNGGVLLHCCRWIYVLEILHYWVFACMSMHHSHIESYEKCKRRCTFT